MGNSNAILSPSREAITLRRYLAPQHEALRQLSFEEFSWLSELNRAKVREVADRLLHHLDNLEAFRERASVLQAELSNRMSEQLNSRMYVLSIVAAMFLPLGFLTGLVGINLGGIPGSESPFGFLVFSLLMIMILALQLWYFSRKHWFQTWTKTSPGEMESL